MPEVIRLTEQPDLVETTKYPYGNWPHEKFNVVQSRLMDVYDTTANIVVSATTNSGKTISAEMIAAYEIRKNKKKAIYIGPMKALAKEKEVDWKKPDHHFKDCRVSICTGSAPGKKASDSSGIM
jgi:replicative superfamily II helicase